MKINCEYKPELLVSTEKRWVNSINQGCQLTQDKNGKTVLVATNGHGLVAVPVTLEDGETTPPACKITKEQLVRARKLAKASRQSEIEIGIKNETLVFADNATEPVNLDDKYPAWEEITNDLPRRGEDGVVTLGINAKLLLKIAEALGASNDQVQLSFKPEPEDSDRYKKGDVISMISVKRANGDEREIAVLMPCFLDQK